ncbi:hypothetical protein AQ490_17455 [Wenjunlia vitaminophila]|uniref:Uncharacterized protein n=1 Tax=Wenjunlia vitaminophila TaxID=76728 RepID=A0A0T6LVG9_WENVI|nr:hypothetical protein [Wenjunlia vitaminophila]KRV50016.1 hypothetical protein AQ490_17455 [Wenjunlia vitaminophila]
MRAARILAAAVLTGAALGGTAPAALAEEPTEATRDAGEQSEGTGSHAPHDLRVTPQRVYQGGKVTVTVRGENCRHGQGHVESRAFPRTALNALRTEGAAYAAPSVHRDISPGPYAITVSCRGRSVTGAPFTVIHGHGPEGGEGGSVEGVSTLQTAVGAALVAAAVGGSVYLTRRHSDGGSA